MRNLIYLLVLFLFPLISFSQNPGGVGTNLSVWLDAKTGVYEAYPALDAAEHADRVSRWADRSGNGNDAFDANGGTDRPFYRSNAANNINFLNPVIDFDGINDEIGGSAGYYTDNIFTVIIPKSNITYTSGGVYYLCGDNPGGTYGAYSYLGAGNASTTNEVIGQGVGHSLQYQRAYSSTTETLLAGIPYIVESRHNAPGSVILLYLNGERVDNATAGSFRSSTDEPWVLGNLYKDVNAYSSFKVSELIIYTDRNINSDVNKIQSYLAIKYGITLDQTTPTSYYASDGVIIYPAASTHTSYDFDIAGVGRDDDSGLNQTISKSVNQGSDVTMEASSISNLNFLVWGDNGTSIASGNTTNKPGVIDVRLNKVWRVAERGNVTIDNLSVDLTGAPGSLDLTNLALLIDDDGDFSDAQIFIDGVNVVGNVVSFTGVDFDHGDYFTIGSASVVLSVDYLSFNASLSDNNSVLLAWSTSEETDNDFFTIERTYDGKTWQEVGTVKGAGTSIVPNDYTYVDFPESNGTIYYRIKQTDFDGKSTYSGIKSVNARPEKHDFQLFPNPNSGSFTVLTDPDSQVLDLKLYDMLGRERSFDYSLAEGAVRIDAPGLLNGTYVLVLTTEDSKVHLKYQVELNDGN